MKAGNLVKVTRARIGLPSGTLGLIVKVLQREVDPNHPTNALYVDPNHPTNYWDSLYIVQLCGDYPLRRFLWRDLEVLS